LNFHVRYGYGRFGVSPGPINDFTRPRGIIVVEKHKPLLSRGARFDLKHKYGGTPAGTAIYCAANFRNPYGQYAAVVQLLIEAGEKVTNDRLEFAVANDLDEIATVLKAHGALL
jgi:hypothetical protein